MHAGVAKPKVLSLPIPTCNSFAAVANQIFGSLYAIPNLVSLPLPTSHSLFFRVLLGGGKTHDFPAFPMCSSLVRGRVLLHNLF